MYLASLIFAVLRIHGDIGGSDSDEGEGGFRCFTTARVRLVFLCSSMTISVPDVSHPQASQLCCTFAEQLMS